ncbi:MAG: hypothetical protein ABI651_19750 [Verrucomicrobiota bacterium]
MKTKLYRMLGSALTAFLLAGCAPWSEPQHVFSVQPAPAFLTEELAVAKARDTLAKEGYNPNEWEITRALLPPSTAPDGTPDKYFVRWSYGPWRDNAGRVMFIKGKRHRTYDIRLEGNRVVCSAFHGL